MRSDCTMQFSQFCGIPCQNIFCIMRSIIDNVLGLFLFHINCLIHYARGNIKICDWCTIWCGLNAMKLNKNETFETAPYAIPTKNNNSYYYVYETFSISTNINDNNSPTDYFAVLCREPTPHKRIYYVLQYNKLSTINIRGVSNKFITQHYNKHLSISNRQKLIDSKYTINITNTMDQNKPTITAEILIKTNEHNNSTIEFVVINGLYPKYLAHLNGEMSVQLLYDQHKKKIKQSSTGDQWNNTGFAIQFGNFNYKWYIKHDPNKTTYQPKHRYQVVKCSNIWQNPKFKYIHEENKKWINTMLNPLIRTASKTINELFYWNNLQINADGMVEQLLYSRELSRHIDGHPLFHPDIRNKSDGMFLITKNFINATIKHTNGKYTVIETGVAQDWCIWKLAPTIHSCNLQALNYNCHLKLSYDEKSQFRPILLGVGDGPRSFPHKPITIIPNDNDLNQKTYTSCNMYRVYTTDGTEPVACCKPSRHHNHSINYLKIPNHDIDNNTYTQSLYPKRVYNARSILQEATKLSQTIAINSVCDNNK